MATRWMRRRVLAAFLTVALCLVSAGLAAASDDRMADAQRLYDDAKYTQALETLDQVAAERPSAAVHQYRALCFIALGRAPDAERAMSEIVALDPFFVLDDETASPRVVTMFGTVRRRLLPPMIRRGFAEATALYREGSRDRAHQRFDEVLRLLDDASVKGDQGLADLALVASAFVELTRAPQPIAAAAPAVASSPSVAAPSLTSAPAPAPASGVAAPVASAAAATPAAAPPAVPATAPAAEPPSARLSGSAVLFEPAVALVRPLPKWAPPDARAATQRYAGTITVGVDETGKVVSAVTKRVIHPAYDQAVIEAAHAWVYRPARQNGVPVRSEVNVDVELLPLPPASN